MKKMFQFIALLAIYIGLFSCSTTSNIIWTPQGGPTASLSLESDYSSNFYAAIRSVDGNVQGNPWTLYKASKSKATEPEVLGEGNPANLVTLDATAHTFGIDFYYFGGLLGKSGWIGDNQEINIKALEAGKEYTLIMNPDVPLSATKTGATATLSLYKNGFISKLVQRWFLIPTPKDGSKVITNSTPIQLKEDTELSMF